jgi:type I restriction enzyme, R subunit
LRVKATPEAQPVAVALIEAKAESLPPNHGMEQAKNYCKRMNVPFVFSSNGHLFVEFDSFTGMTSASKRLTEFPTPAELQRRYEQNMDFTLDSPLAKPLLSRYAGGEATRRYYQDAAIRATLEKIARGEKRALLSLATGAGKTFIAVNLLKRIADAGQLRRALFLCDRDELRSQGLTAFQGVFGADAAEVYKMPDGRNNAQNARIHVATYQTLDVDTPDGTAKFLTTFYPENYFSHIVIDECHRSAWGEWSLVLTRNPDAVQIGLTATPRQLRFVTGKAAPQDVKYYPKGEREDAKILADNLKHFGQPVYEYDLVQGSEDGYLAAMDLQTFDLFHENKKLTEREVGVSKDDLAGKTLIDANTGEILGQQALHDHYTAPSLEDKLLLPDRVKAMTDHLFQQLIENGGPEQKTIIFCRRDRHADDVATAMNNLYARWCAENNKPRLDSYAFKCTASVSGNDALPDLRGSSRSHFIATTVELLTTGVDVPVVRNIVFFKYVDSPIAFYQMIGRGTRLDPPTNKLMFRVYDYTNASRLFGEKFLTGLTPKRKKGEGPEPPPPPEPTIIVEGVEVHVSDAGRFILTRVDGKAMPVTVEKYKEILAARLMQEAETLEAFRRIWIDPRERHEMMKRLPDNGTAPFVVQRVEEMNEFDLYDVLAELGYGLAARSRTERADAFTYKHTDWLKTLPPETARALAAIVMQFARAGTEGLESPQIFSTPDVAQAGGLKALKAIGDAAEVLTETKKRIFAS